MGQGNVKITNSNDHNITVTYWMSRVILSVLNFEFRSLVFFWARPSLRLVDPTPRRARLDWFLPPSVAGFQLEVINTVSVYPVWARDLFLVLGIFMIFISEQLYLFQAIIYLDDMALYYGYLAPCRFEAVPKSWAVTFDDQWCAGSAHTTYGSEVIVDIQTTNGYACGYKQVIRVSILFHWCNTIFEV